MRLGLFAAVGLAFALAACSGTTSTTAVGGVKQAHEQPPPDVCEDVQDCLTLTAGKNISHVFLDFACEPGDFDVVLVSNHFGSVTVTDLLQSEGGPCRSIARDFTFEVPGPDRSVQVCVIFYEERS
jgi:hypothetical protein